MRVTITGVDGVGPITLQNRLSEVSRTPVAAPVGSWRCSAVLRHLLVLLIGGYISKALPVNTRDCTRHGDNRTMRAKSKRTNEQLCRQEDGLWATQVEIAALPRLDDAADKGYIHRPFSSILLWPGSKNTWNKRHNRTYVQAVCDFVVVRRRYISFDKLLGSL